MLSTIKENPTIEVNYQEILQKCLSGRVPPELKELYKAPFRDYVDWLRFPIWARPSITEGCHEG